MPKNFKSVFFHLDFNLQEPIPVSELALMALNDPVNEWEESYGTKEKLSNRCAKLLFSKAAMLDDYFSIKVAKIGSGENEKICLIGLPMLMEDYEPDLVGLPSFIIRLATEVDYDNEKDCFNLICKELGYFHSVKNKKYSVKVDLRNMLLVSTESQDTIFLKLVDLSKLYKVFERC